MSSKKSPLPSTVNVYGVPYTVIYKPALKDDGGELLQGLLKVDRHTIYVNADYPETAQTTLTHEYLHASLYQSGVSELLKHKVEEAVVLALETALTHLMKPWKPESAIPTKGTAA